MDAGLTKKTIETVWRIEAARLIGGLMRIVRDVDRAEDLAQEALLAALERWPETGIPDNPGAWLMTTARHRAVDESRRRVMASVKHAQIGHETPTAVTFDEEQLDVVVGDDVLRLILATCHPVLSQEARVALTLRLVASLSTAEIARAFVISEVTMAQRLVRAKRTLAEAKVPFDVPGGDELRARVPPALEVIYLVFNEGYAAASGDDWIRPALCEEAMRLGRILCGLLKNDAEAHGLLALMELQASRNRARVNANGEPILLLEQDRAKWDYRMIERGLSALTRAEALSKPLGPYTLQAAIAACHARARRAAETNWERIVALYDALVALTGSPIVELNRAVAVSMAFGPSEALPLVDELAEDGALDAYHLLWAVRADLLLKLGRSQEARRELERAAGLTTNTRERKLLQDRAAACTAPTPGPAN